MVAIPIYERPKGLDGEWDPPLIILSEYSREEQIEYWRKRAHSVKYFRDRCPAAFEHFKKLYGSELAEELASQA